MNVCCDGRYFRKRRCAFVHLARSQRARVVKATYELLMVRGLTHTLSFSP